MASNLQCSRCSAGNRAGRQFCAQCGARLPLTCPVCGFENEAGEKFCGGCGAALAAKSAPSPVIDATVETPAEALQAVIPPAAPTADAERRPVTVLFADLVDYTRMSRALDPEDVHAMLERYYATADEIVERFGGSVDKHIGDSVMAVFGAPIAHDDDAVRAVRAAAEIHRAMPTVGGATGERLAVHVGIASGEVVASGLGSNRHRAYTVIGNSVNLAARLLKLAGTGETVLDEAVHAAVQRVARCTPIEDARVKGIDAPLTAWRFVEFVDSGERARMQPFVGRAAELAQLDAALASCAAGGTGGTVLVRGDAGIGKSRLVNELRSRAIASGFACHTALVLDFGMARGREAVREIAMSLMQLSPESDDEARREALRALFARHPDLVGDEPFLRDIAGIRQGDRNALYEAMDNAARQQGRAAAVVRLLAIGCAQSPILLVIEDVHWADKVTLDAIAALTRAVGGLRAILVLTSRVAGDPLTAAWRASVQGSPLLTIDLGPLGAKDAIDLAGGIFTAPSEFVRKCVERSGGNPLFLEQLMRTAGEQGDALPASLSSLVLARMDRLPEPDRVALRAAAVVGQRFPLALVRDLTQMPRYTCDVLMAHFLVLPAGDEYLFAHALIRDGVYASLTRARRAELHRAAARWYGERDPALVAEHLDRADAPEAPRAYLAAALAQAGALQPERALALAERGSSLAKAPDDVVALNMMLGRLHWESGEGQPAIDACEKALAATREPAERCRALIGIASGHRLLGGVEAALAALAEAEPLSHGLPRESCELHYIRGNLAFAQGNNAMCHAEHQAALRFAASLGDPLWEVNATSGLGDADYAEGRMLTALARFRRCVELCDAHGLPRPAAANLAMAGFCRFFALEFDEAFADLEAARALGVKLGNRYAEMFTLEGQGSLLTFCDRYAEARPFVERGLELASAIGAKRYEATLLTELAEVDFAGGHAVEARRHVDHALALFRDIGMGFWGPTALGLRARLTEDESERARDRAEAEALLAAGCLSHNHIGYHRFGIDDALERGEWSRAMSHAAALETYTAAEPLPYCDFLVARARTLVGLVANPDDVTLQRDLARLEEKAHVLRWRIGWSVPSAAHSRSTA